MPVKMKQVLLPGAGNASWFVLMFLIFLPNFTITVLRRFNAKIS